MAASSASRVAVARLVAAAAREVPDVVDLHGGVLGEVATYGQDGPVRGVRVPPTAETRLKVHLVVRFGARLDEVAEQVRSRVAAMMAEHAPALAGAIVDVHVADVRPDGQQTAQQGQEHSA